MEFYSDRPENSTDYTRIVTEFHTERLGKMIDAVKDKVIFGG